MTPLVVTGMYGIGDNIHQRAVLRELMKTRQVWLRTYYQSLYHDLINDGLMIIPQPGLKPRIKDSVPVKVVKTPNAETIKIMYTKESTAQHGSLIAGQFASAGLVMPAQPDFSLPVKPEWREAAKHLLAGKNASGKPIMIYRPIVLNKVWECPARSPDPETYSKIFQSIKDRFYTVSVADLTSGNEHIVGAEEKVDLKLHKGEAIFEALAGLFAEAALVYANPGFAPLLAQAVGTPGIVVYGGHESYRTTNLPGSFLAPTLAIEPNNPCECFSRFHNCDKRIDLEVALPKVRSFVDQVAPPKPRVLIFGTTFVDSEDKKKLAGQWMKLHRHLNPYCDLLLVDSASPVKWQADDGVKVFDFGDNIGHLARGGKDGWGRAFIHGLQAAIDGEYDYAVHIEGDSLCRLQVEKHVAAMRNDSIEVICPPVDGTNRKEIGWSETGLMFFDVAWLKSSGFIDKYNWQKRTAKPTPEAVIHRIIAENASKVGDLGVLGASRGDNGAITPQNVQDYAWVTHCRDQRCYDRFVGLVIPPVPLVKLNFGCGTNKLEGWRNFDMEVNITKPLPFPNAYADFIYAEHCVEHVSYKHAISFFVECCRVLKKGGVVRIAVPSLENIWKRGDQEYFDFVRKWSPTPDLRGAMHAIIFAHGHEAIWTRGLLEAALYFSGFDEVTPCEPHESKHFDLVDVEGHHRVIGERMNWIESAIVEGRK